MTTLLDEGLETAGVEERIAASLETIASELERIRIHLDERAGGETPSVVASSGPWLHRLAGR